MDGEQNRKRKELKIAFGPQTNIAFGPKTKAVIELANFFSQ